MTHTVATRIADPGASHLVALMGDPVAGNPTGVMFNMAFAHLGLDWHYASFEVTPDRLGEAVRGVRALGFEGAHCTIPHKVAVMRHLDVWTDRAQMIGAVNVIRRRGDGALVGDNTDGAGFIEDLEERGHSIRGASFVIFGAGGAARALSVEVALLRPRSILVLNRSPDRLAQLMKIHEAAGHGIEVTGAQATHQFRVPAGTDFVVNATSLGMTPDNGMPDVDLESLREDTVVCDVVPNPADTPLLIAAGQRGCPTVDGRGMLIHQAAIAFRDWTGLPAPKAVMRAALDAALDVSGSNVSDSNTAKGTV